MSVVLNGTSQWLEISYNSSLDITTNFAISFWLKTSKDYSSAYAWLMRWYDGTKLAGIRICTNNRVQFSMHDGSNEIVVYSSGTINDGQWHYARAYRYNSGHTGSLTIDSSTTSATNNSLGSLVMSPGEFAIGSYPGGGSKYFQGSVAHVFFADMSSDMRTLYDQSSANGYKPMLRRNCKVALSLAGNLKDYSTLGNDATGFGSPTYESEPSKINPHL